MRSYLIAFFALFLILNQGISQQEEIGGFWFGPKLGPTIGMQNWDGLERRAMFNYHGAMFIESLDPDYKGSLYAQLGYHSRGSALNFFSAIGGAAVRQSYVFNNISLQLGAKKRLITTSLQTPYYFVGIRLEYQLSNNLEELLERYANPFYPHPQYVNDLTYGISFGGGFEFYGSEYVQPALELTVSPDMSFQYTSPPFTALHPFDGRTVNVNQRQIRNITLEISLTIRFLRKVVFID